MKSGKSHSDSGKRPFAGSVELVPPPPKLIEFIDAHRLWAFPIEQLAHLVLENNPEQHGKRTLPPDQLTLVYPDALVTLRGWRLELMLGPLVTGRVARIHTEKHLGPLVIEEAWVSEIHVTSITTQIKWSTTESSVPVHHA
jgi:hypothetical protein